MAGTIIAIVIGAFIAAGIYAHFDAFKDWIKGMAKVAIAIAVIVPITMFSMMYIHPLTFVPIFAGMIYAFARMDRSHA